MQLKHHKDLTIEKWQSLSLAERMANVGSEVIRTLNWKEKDIKQADLAFERSLELFDLTKMVETSHPRKREIARLKETWVDFIAGDNLYQTSQQLWESEFISYTFLAMNKN
jgi:hypothetical protein